MRFRILGSSSAGNSALICTDGCKVLLDAGFSGRRMEALLDQAGAQLEEIDAIFITHEHSDHVSGLRGLTRKRPDIKIFANETTARIVQERMPRTLNWQIFENNLPFAFRDLEISPFSIPHDAYDPVGYHFSERSDTASHYGRNDTASRYSRNDAASNHGRSDATHDGGQRSATPESEQGNTAHNLPRSLCWLTDLGYVTATAARYAAQCDLLVIEANHDPDMLERCQTRSWSTKQRIRGRHGHLCNQAAYQLLASVQNPRWRHVCLAHISTECNSLEIVEQQFAPLRNGAHNLDIHIFDPARSKPGAEFNLRPQASASADTAANTDAGVGISANTDAGVGTGTNTDAGANASAQANAAKTTAALPPSAPRPSEPTPRTKATRSVSLTQIEISLKL